jgi:hypothetical protein
MSVNQSGAVHRALTLAALVAPLLASCAGLLPGSDAIPVTDDGGAGADASPLDAGDTATDASDAGSACTDAGCGGNRIVQIAATTGQGCALTLAGSVWCWGSNEHGQLGVRPSASPSACPFVLEGGQAIPCNPTPTEVPGLHDVTQIALGNGSACALDRSGSVWCWGDNSNGNLGHPASRDDQCTTPVVHACNSTPTKIPNLTAKWISQNEIVGCAVTSADKVACWGGNSHGELGIGAMGESVSSPQVIPDLDGVAKVVTGWPNCALKHDGSVLCWGNGGLALGHAPGTHGDYDAGADGSYALSPTPIYIKDNVTPAFGVAGQGAGVATDISTGLNTACAVAGGEVWCWGDDSAGVVGASSNGSHFDPVRLGAAATSLSIELTEGCLVQANGVGQCWGQGAWGETGIGHRLLDASEGDCTDHFGCVLPTNLASPGPWQQVSAAFGQAMGLKSDGTVWAWGINDTARLGHAPGTKGDLACSIPNQAYPCQPTPVQVLGLP